MTVTRYKRDRSTEAIRDAVMGVIRHKREAQPAEPAKPAKPAAPASGIASRTAEDLEKHHAKVVAPMRISPTTMARAKSKRRAAAVQEQAIRSSFKAYDPPPGTLPHGAEPDMALDNALQSWAQTSATNAWDFVGAGGNSFAEGIGFLGYAYLSQLTERPEYRRISERIAIEMTRKWIRLTISGEADPEKKDDDEAQANDGFGYDRQPDADLDEEEQDDADGAAAGVAVADSDDDQDDEPTPEEKAQRKRNEALQKKLKEIDADMKRLDVRGKFKSVAEFDGWMGRAHLYIDTGDGDDPDELKSNLGNGSDDISKEKFKKGSLRNIKNIEAIWCYPVNYNANDPLADDWYNPQVWFAMAKQIHVSRLLTFVGRPLPDILKPSYAFGGLSMSQMAKPYVDNWLRTRQAVTNLIESFSTSGIYTNAQSLLQGGGDDVLDRIEMFNANRSNLGSMVLDKETEEFFNISTPLGTLDQLQAQSQEQMSAVSGIPLIVLLGITPHGLNASSEGELRVFYDLIHAMQENLFRDKLKRVIDFIQLHLYGEVDPAIGFEFEPLWSLDEKGEAEVRKIKAETHMIYADGGVVGTDEVRQIEIDDDNSPYNGLDPDDMPDLAQEEADGLGEAGGASSSGGDGSSGRADNKEVDGAADSAITEVAEDVFAFDDGQFEESKHKRDSDGKFATTGGAGGKSEDPLENLKIGNQVSFKSKKEHIGHLLSKGTTPKELMQAMGWPSVSMPAQAKSLGMKLEKKDGKYFGIKMTDAEIKAAKEEAKGKETDKQAQQILKNAGLESMAGKPAPKLAPAKKAEVAPVKPAEPAKATPAATKLTDEQVKKAGKGTPVSLNLIAGEKPSIAGSPQMKGVEAQIKAFNDKYAGKQLNDTKELAEKVEAYKNLAAYTNTAAKEESANKAKIEKQVKEQEAKEEAERKAKKQAELEAKFAADPDLKVHHEAMEALFGGQSAGEAYIKQAMSKVKAAGLKDHMSAADAVPVIAYSGSHYVSVNKELRRGTMTMSQYKFMKSLNAGLEKMPKYTQTTYRKADLSPEQVAAYVPGHIVEERGFTSTSKNQGTWHGSYQFTVHGKNGRDISKLSSHPVEAEVLFKSGARFHVKSVKGNHIELEEV